MANEPLVYLRLSPAQARAINKALAHLEAEGDPGVKVEVIERTRAKVHEAMAAVGVKP